MPITQKDILEHRDQHQIPDLDTLHTAEYRKLVDNFAFIFMGNGNLRHTLSEEILATNREQLDVLIEKLQEFRERMDEAPEWMSEK